MSGQSLVEEQMPADLTAFYLESQDSHKDKELSEKLKKFEKIFHNPRTAESLAKSYLRCLDKGIDLDGRESSIVVETTKRCNKKCGHCYSRSYGQDLDMETGLLGNIIDYGHENFKHIFLTGGEPLMDKRLFGIAEKYDDIMFFMFTNGSLIDDSVADRMGGLGNIVPLLSIDGLGESKHDSFKGKGSYKEIAEAVMKLNQANASWGYIALVCEKNARDVLDPSFIKHWKDKGAVFGRYIEYHPVGSFPNKDLILSGETYSFMERRKKEILRDGEIYMQETLQPKCRGLTFFDVRGNIKNCPFFHYSKHNALGGDIARKVDETISDWMSAKYAGECPVYSDPESFEKYLLENGWKCTLPEELSYLRDPSITGYMKDEYQHFLDLKAYAGE